MCVEVDEPSPLKRKLSHVGVFPLIVTISDPFACILCRPSPSFAAPTESAASGFVSAVRASAAVSIVGAGRICTLNDSGKSLPFVAGFVGVMTMVIDVGAGVVGAAIAFLYGCSAASGTTSIRAAKALMSVRPLLSG